MLVFLAAKANLVEMLRRDRGDQQQACECDAADSRDFFREKIEQRGDQQDEENAAQENGKLDSADADVERNLEFPRAAILEAEHHHSQGDENEAPDHAEGIRLS